MSDSVEKKHKNMSLNYKRKIRARQFFTMLNQFILFEEAKANPLSDNIRRERPGLQKLWSNLPFVYCI